MTEIDWFDNVEPTCQRITVNELRIESIGFIKCPYRNIILIHCVDENIETNTNTHMGHNNCNVMSHTLTDWLTESFGRIKILILETTTIT